MITDKISKFILPVCFNNHKIFSSFNLYKEQRRKQSVYIFQSTEKDVKKDAYRENLSTNLSNASASGMDVISKC